MMQQEASLEQADVIKIWFASGLHGLQQPGHFRTVLTRELH